MNRRDVLKGAVAVGVLGGTYAIAQNGTTSTDGTPLQFAPRTQPDPNPLQDELQKYPRCPYCGMDRAEWHQTRHLVHYDDDRVDPTCSLHCVAISLSLNMDRGPKAIYAPDYGSAEEPRPLHNVDDVTYLIGSDIKGTMTSRSKLAFAEARAARNFQQRHGGNIGTFDMALTASYRDMARDTIAIRRRRAERQLRQTQP